MWESAEVNKTGPSPAAASPLPASAAAPLPPSAASAPAPHASSSLSPGQPGERPGRPHPVVVSAPGSGFVLPCGQIKSIEGKNKSHKALCFLILKFFRGLKRLTILADDQLTLP